jgi:F-box interacting protein
MDIISDPQFIKEHMVYAPKFPPTHTIVFFPGFAYGSSQDPRNGRGFLFDEHWRLKAELTAGRWDDLIGACNGLLCFLEAGQGSIKIIEPFTGESLAVQTPPEASGLRWSINPAAYCFGFDAISRRYKIVHHGYLPREGEAVGDEELHVYTVGGGEGWTRMHVAGNVHGEAYGDPLYVDGAVYWPTRARRSDSIRRRDEKLVRFDLATEQITSEVMTVCLRLDGPRTDTAVFCRLTDSAPCVITYGRSGEWDAWFPDADGDGALSLPSGGRVLLRGKHSNDPGLSVMLDYSFAR